MWIFFLIIYTVNAYHTTETLLKEAQEACTFPCSYTYYDDILVLDWKKDLEKDTLWVFNEHARERITGELGLEIIKDLHLLNSSKRITIVPVLNVWGRKQVDKGRTCLRKNKNGVDTNRNYPQRIKHHYQKYSEEYEGPYPFSEKETKLVRKLLKDVKSYYNIHSGEYSMYMPWDSSTNKPPKYITMKQKLNKYKPMCPECSIGSAAVVSSYKAYGTSVDYATTLGIEAYTFEIYGKESWDCKTMFNPTGKKFDHVISMWKSILKETA